MSTPDILREALRAMLEDDDHDAAKEKARRALAAPGQAPQPIGHVEIIDALAFIAVREGCEIDDGQPLYAGASPQAAVPAEPTTAMVTAGALALHHVSIGEFDATDDEVRAVWNAMYAARPQAQPTPTDTPT